MIFGAWATGTRVLRYGESLTGESMGETSTVEALLALQEFDSRILRVETELEEISRSIKESTAELAELEAEIPPLAKDVADAEREVRRFERVARAGRTTLKRLEDRSRAVANMQQHFAVRTEADTARRNLREAEDRQLSAMQDLENSRAKLEGMVERRDALLSEVEGQRAVAEARSQNLRSELDQLRTRRDARARPIDRKSLRVYNSVRRQSGRRALAGLTEDGVCGDCFTSVPKQWQANIRASVGLTVCEDCGVILYAGAGT